MNMISYIKKFILSTRWRLLWYAEFYAVKIKKLIPFNVTPLEIKSSDSILILAPHADDEWVGCYSLLKSKKEGITCCYMNLYGKDYSASNISTRTQEIMKSSQYWGFDLRIINNDSIEDIKECIIGKSKCFIPSPYDWHPEHRKTFCLFYKAYSLLSDSQKEGVNVYYYSVSVPHSNREVLDYIPLTKEEICQKWIEFNNIYSSQSFMPSLRYKLQLRLVPQKVGYAAQMFVCSSEDRMKSDYNKVNSPVVIDKLNESSRYIYNILKSRQIVNNIIYSDQQA